MKRPLISAVTAVSLCAACSAPAPAPKPAPTATGGGARNVILLLADAAGIPTLNAASLLGYGKPMALNVQHWPNLGLSDTSTAVDWVSDSAAGMTAIMTGTKTLNGVLSQSPDAEPGVKNGTPLMTLLERAEDHGFATGVVTSQSIADATPAACYAHANEREAAPAALLAQAFAPRFGDGVDVLIGAGKSEVEANARETGVDPAAIARTHGRQIYAGLGAVPASDARPVVMIEGDLDVPKAARLAIKTLARNPKGYFLMIEWDAHTIDVERGLRNVVGFDKLAADIAASVNLRDTLILFAADHSFDLRLVGGARGTDLLSGLKALHRSADDKTPLVLPALEVSERHTGEEVLVAAIGAGADRVHGYFPNTQLFHVMMNAYGWDDASAARIEAPGPAGQRH